MALSWNEIKDRAVSFSKEWEDTFNEEAEAKPFLEAFLMFLESLASTLVILRILSKLSEANV